MTTEKKKKIKQLLRVLATIVGAMLLFGCGTLVGLISTVPVSQSAVVLTVVPTEIYVPRLNTTEANATNEAAIVPLPTAAPQPTAAPVPTRTPAPTSTPAPLTAGDIERHRNSLTNLQRDLYEQEVVGEIIWFKGQISEVLSNGDVLLDDSSMSWNLVRLQGIPLEVATALSKDQLFEGLGVVSEVSSGFLGLGMSIDIWVTSWNN